jgi:hypothetical protein
MRTETHRSSMGGKMTEENYAQELGKISMWLDDFAANDSDGTYICFLRLICDYRRLQAQELEEFIQREEARNK